LLWSLVAVALVGFVLGLRLRAPGMLVTAAMLVAATAAAGLLAGHSGGAVLVSVLLTVMSFQAGYLVGVAAFVIWQRRRGRGRDV
jgi:ABC-type Mn2+/Zn2+ transport system permease subunit